jgi:hypothetical protein
MKHFLFLLFFSVLFLKAENNETVFDVIVAHEPVEEVVVEKDSNETLSQESPDLVVVKDESGLSDKEVREIAKKSDKAKKEKVSIKKVFEVTNEEGKVDVSKLQSWEKMSPTPNKYDWIQTKSGEWFKGSIKAMFNKDLEFDSDELGLTNFDFEDIIQIKSFHIIGVNIDAVATFSGIIRLKNNEINIIQGDNKYTFPKNQVISLAPKGIKWIDIWSAKITVSIDGKKGNKDQFDYNVKFNIKRRTEKTRLTFDYLGRFSKVNNIDTANDHRLNEKYDVYLSRKLFWTPIFSEFYKNEFQNIDKQYTVGAGIGYTLLDIKRIKLDFSGGPAILNTKYIDVKDHSEDNLLSPALELSTKLDLELNKITDIIYSYKLTYTNNESGRYMHHMILTLENEITSWLDIDFTGIWDHIKNPQEKEDKTTPERDDYQLLIGLGIEF